MSQEKKSEVQGWLRKVNTVVDKNGPVCPNTVYLPKEKPCTFGRSSSGVNTQLVSRKTPLMISRKHATVGCHDGQWMITDHESLNGVFVNGVKIKANDPYPLFCGDKVAFGIAVGNSKSPEFEYIFQEVSQDYKLKRSRQNVDDDEDNVINHKRKCENEIGVKNESTEKESNSIFEEQIKIQEDKIKELTEELLTKAQAHNDLALTLERKEQDLEEQLEKQRNELQIEKFDAERKLQELLEKQLIEKENMLKKNFEGKINALETERDFVEKKLQKELNDKLTEKDESYREELEKQKEALNKILTEMQLERNNRELEMQKNQELLNNLKNAEKNEKELGASLEELRRQIQEKDKDLHKQEEITKKAEEDGKRLVLHQMEEEFTCMICHELFVHAVTLTCAHSFCEMCLRAWMKKKKECPVCRGKITGRAVKSVVLDSAIRKMVENADNETKQNREHLISQRIALREAEQAKGFEKLLVTDDDHQTERAVHNQSHLQHWNGRPANQDLYRFNNFIPGAQTHDVFSNRYTYVSSSVSGQNQAVQSTQARRYDERRPNAEGGRAPRMDQNSSGNRGRDGRRPSFDGHRSGGQSHQQSRGWNSGNCFICGHRGHYARHCYLNNNNR